MGSLWMKLAEDLSPTVSLGQEADNVPWVLPDLTTSGRVRHPE